MMKTAIKVLFFVFLGHVSFAQTNSVTSVQQGRFDPPSNEFEYSTVEDSGLIPTVRSGAKAHPKIIQTTTNESIGFTWKGQIPLKLEVYDLTGKRVKVAVSESDHLSLSTISFPSSVYLFRLSSPKGIYSGSLLKQ